MVEAQRMPPSRANGWTEMVDRVLEELHLDYERFAGRGAPLTPPELAPATLNETLATVLSPSQVKKFRDCQARWWFKYGLGLEDTTNADLALGRAIHEPLGANYQQKIDSKVDLPLAQVVEHFRDSWAQLKTEITPREDDDLEAMGDTGAALTELYMRDRAPSIQPAAVEVEVAGEIGGVHVRGKVDVIDVAGTIVDVKSAKKAPSGINPDYRFQVATYAQITPGAAGTARLDTLTKTKTVKLIEQTFSIDGADLVETRTIYPLVQEQMRSGLYTPNRNSFLCSKRNCPYWRQCETEYGGHVEER